MSHPCRGIEHRCILLEDEAKWVRHILRKFEAVGRRDLFLVLFLGGDREWQTLRETSSQSASLVGDVRREPAGAPARGFNKDPGNLVSYLSGHLRGATGDSNNHVLIVADQRLADPKHSPAFPTGAEIVEQALSGADGEQRCLEDVRVIVLSLFPELLVDSAAGYRELRAALQHRVQYFDKSRQLNKAIAAIDAWRVEHAQRGSGPGPSLQRLLDKGLGLARFDFWPVVSLSSGGAVQYYRARPVDAITERFPRAAYGDAALLGGEYPHRLDLGVFRALERWANRADPTDRGLPLAIEVQAESICTEAFRSEALHLGAGAEVKTAIPPSLLTLIVHFGQQPPVGSADAMTDIRRAGYRLGVRLSELPDSSVIAACRQADLVELSDARAALDSADWMPLLESLRAGGIPVAATGVEAAWLAEEVSELRRIGISHIDGTFSSTAAATPSLSIVDTSRLPC